MATQLKKSDGKDGDGQGMQTAAAAAKPASRAKSDGGKTAKDGSNQNKLVVAAMKGDGVHYIDGLNHEDEVEVRIIFRRREELGGTVVIRNPTPPPPPPITVNLKFG